MKVINKTVTVELEFDQPRELILSGAAAYSGKPVNFLVRYLRIDYPVLDQDERVLWRVYAVKLNKDGSASARGNEWINMWHFSSEARARVEEIAKECDPR